jgi:chaperone modulatory protein CbpM
MAAMMLTIEELALQIQVEVHTVHAWIEEGWLLPEREAAATFTEVDLARAQLILDLKRDLGVNDEGIGIILDLLDQVHGLRQALRHLGVPAGRGTLGGSTAVDP